VYNNHIFIQHDDDRLGSTDINWDEAPGYNVTDVGADEAIRMGIVASKLQVHTFQAGAPTQSLPDFTNPCARIWARYFDANASTRSWFTGQHSVSQAQFDLDCNSSTQAWRHGIKQIRYVQLCGPKLPVHLCVHPYSEAELFDSVRKRSQCVKV
jgi:hypothetical protein